MKDIACLYLTGDPEECHFFFQPAAELPLVLLNISNLKYGHGNFFMFDMYVQRRKGRKERGEGKQCVMGGKLFLLFRDVPQR